MSALIHDRGRGPEIVGTRITVYDVFPYLQTGTLDRAQIAELFRITDEQLAAAIDCIDAHREEVLTEHCRIETRNDRGNLPEVEAKLVETRRRMAEWKVGRIRAE
jgi:uncharacterized protein (DUF433 family)